MAYARLAYNQGKQGGRRRWPLQQDRLLLSRVSPVVLDPDLTARFAHRSFGDTFRITPKDTPRDKEGLR
jgi:hypothetical protein